MIFRLMNNVTLYFIVMPTHGAVLSFDDVAGDDDRRHCERFNISVRIGNRSFCSIASETYAEAGVISLACYAGTLRANLVKAEGYPASLRRRSYC